MATTYVHPSSGAEVVDVVCPKGHAGGKGHIMAAFMNATTGVSTVKCGQILKSHKTTGPEEIDNGKKVRPTVTVVDLACEEFLVAADDKKGAKAAKAVAAEKAAADVKATKGAGTKAAKAANKKGGKKGAKPVGRHPQSVA